MRPSPAPRETLSSGQVAVPWRSGPEWPGESFPFHRSSSAFRVGLLVPRCGAAGLWGPSSIASAEVALSELNRGEGIARQEVELVVIDSAEEASTPAEHVVDAMIANRALDAIVGMHISSVRQRLTGIVKGQIPYVYTPLYEGGENGVGVFAIGDTPPQQLGPAIDWLHETRRPESWALIGNDYVWPRVSHRYAKARLAAIGAKLACERYIPFASGHLVREVETIAASGADAVLVSLVGQDAVDFNRIFGAMELDRKMIRLFCAIEENGLLASGADNLKRLFCSSSYFGSLAGENNARFRERYHGFHGPRAPMLNALGQSTYEGLHFLAAIMEDGGDRWRRPGGAPGRPLTYRSARHGRYVSNRHNRAPTFLARADGLVFEVIARLL